jgi:PucR family transcriptional regulator, purine catabolism regulatory protein
VNGPTITVKDVWRGVLPPGTELLGGGAGLERRVEWACALRTRPPAFDAMKGGEVAFVPVRSIRLLDERLDLPRVMTSFAEKGGVAVAVVGDVTASSITVANQRALPLLRLPDDAHISEVHQACVRYILDQRSVLHERAQELQSALMGLALAGAGPAAIVDRLAEITSLIGAWQDEQGAVRHLTAGEGELFLERQLNGDVDSLLRWGDTVAVAAADPPVREFSLPESGLARIVSPIPARRGVAGFVSLIGARGELTQVASLGVARAAAACAIELDRERAVSETRERLEGEVVESLLAGTYASETAAVKRARRIGLDLDGSTAVIALRATKPGIRNWLNAAERAARMTLQHRHETPAFVGAHEGSLCVVAAVEGSEEAGVRRLAAALREDCARATSDPSLNAGVGRAKPGVVGVRASLREAEQALTLGSRVIGPGKAVNFADLGLYRMLFTLSQHPELREFYQETLGVLLDYDARTGAGLVETLDAYFSCNGSPTDAAQRLHLHRNTVIYRLRRIEEVGGLQLEDAPTRLNLHLCMRIRDVLMAGAAP